MHVWIRVLSIVWIAAQAAGPALAAAPAHPPGLEFFEQRVRPILVEHCLECHGPKKQESGLRLDVRDAAFRGGENGPAFAPGKPEESLLIDAVKYQGLEMPPDGKLSDDEIAALEQWVQLGAPWPADAGPSGPVLGDQKRIFAEAKQHWAFQPVRKPQPPTVKQTDWVRTPVDAFVLARLEQAGLQPAPRADRRTLIRRVTFDLIGLPPTPEEVEAFVADRTPRAYGNLVDRLLASPHYGERWARHWLDIARYADTRDWQAQADPRYPFAFTYRDWVINALNRDMPYDEFIREQLAADEYSDDPHAPNLAALGFLTVGPRFRNNTFEQIADRIDVVTRGLLGLTGTCARCHDHKYDPIPIADYYSLYGVFASCEVPEQLPLIGKSSAPEEVVRDYDTKLAAAYSALKQYKLDLQDEAETDLHRRIGDYLQGWYEMSVTNTESVRSLISKRKLIETAITPLAQNLDRYRKTKPGREDPLLAPLALLAEVPPAQFPGKLNELLAQSEKSGKQRLQLSPLIARMLRDQRPTNAKSLVALYCQLFDDVEKAWKSSQEAAEPPKQLADAGLEAIRQQLYRDDGPFALDAEAVASAARLLATARNKQGKLESAIQEVESTHAGAPARAMVLVDKPQPITPAILLRGDPARRGDRVPRRFLSLLAGENAPPFTHGSGRRDLAEAIVDPKNPLTPRVLINRVWMHHLGKPLVSSPGDFGLRTPAPTHPELLDWLAATFVEQNWSLKRLHRLIVLSNTYQQASEPRQQNASAGMTDPEQVDPENHLLWRANRRRLEFEAMRDAVLVVSGQLDPAVGGRPVRLTEKPFTTRRTIYGYVDRVNLDDLFATFDFPSPDVSNPQRAETMVPQQALFAMNDPFIVAQARKLAALPEVASPAEATARIKALYRRVYDREPKPREIQLAMQFLAGAGSAVEPEHGKWQYGYGTADVEAGPDDRFHRLPFWEGKNYQASAAFPDPKLGHVRLTRNGGHPGRTQETAVVRRWIAPENMTIRIRATLEHLSDRGDGVRGTITTGRGRVLGQWTAFNQSVETHANNVRVESGETIDFIVDCRKANTSDAFNWGAKISMVDGTVKPATAAMMPRKQWDSREDFAAPPPAPLSPWEQLAQALLLTNEFMFID